MPISLVLDGPVKAIAHTGSVHVTTGGIQYS